MYRPIDSGYVQVEYYDGFFPSSFHLPIFKFSAKHMFKKEEKWAFFKKYSLTTLAFLNLPQI